MENKKKWKRGRQPTHCQVRERLKHKKGSTIWHGKTHLCVIIGIANLHYCCHNGWLTSQLIVVVVVVIVVVVVVVVFAVSRQPPLLCCFHRIDFAKKCTYILT
jgi:type IV secretory pathway VirB3-like protein